MFVFICYKIKEKKKLDTKEFFLFFFEKSTRNETFKRI